MEIFKKEYDGESLIDAFRDVPEALTQDYNPLLDDIPVNSDGFSEGTFTITISWKKSYN